MTNKEKFLTLVTEYGAATVKEIENRYKNKDWLKESFMVGFKVLMKLDELQWTQKDLAKAMGVTPQQVNKIVRGKQNLTLETLVKLQKTLHIPIMATFNESTEHDAEKISANEKTVILVSPKRKTNKSLHGTVAQQH